MFTLLFLCGLVIGTSAQPVEAPAKPDFKAIEKNINDKASPYYYPVLMKRYVENDTTLNNEEYRHLYYGFSFQPGYSPYGTSKHASLLSKLFEKEKLSEEDVKEVITIEKKILEDFPFNLRNINTLVSMYDKVKDTINSNLQYKKLIGLGKALLSTGNGFADSTAMYVISVEHEYDMIGLLGFKRGGAQYLVSYKGSSIDKLKLAKNDDDIEFMYFNVDRLFASMQKMFDKKE